MATSTPAASLVRAASSSLAVINFDLSLPNLTPIPNKEPVKQEVKEVEESHTLMTTAVLQTSTMSDDTANLLQRLHELKVWQERQEQRLREEHELQIRKMEDEISDDNTIDHDVSSLSDDDEDDNKSKVGTDDANEPRLLTPAASSLPSWATPSIQKQQTCDHQHPIPNPLQGEEEQEGDQPVGEQRWSEDRPIAHSNSSFEQLLQARLQVANEDSDQRENITNNESTGSPADPNRSANDTLQKKPFLKKKSGLQRYRGMGSPPKRFRSKSQVREATKSGSESHNKETPSTKPLKTSQSCSKLEKATVNNNAHSKQEGESKVRSMSSLQSKKSLDSKSLDFDGNRVQAIQKRLPQGKNQKHERNQSKATPKRSKFSPSNDISSLNAGNRRTNPKLVDNTVNEGDSVCSTSPVHDSVEVSFQEKLIKADQRHQSELADLARFEALEEAAADSSFCSSASHIKKLINNQPEVPSNRNGNDLVDDIELFLKEQGGHLVISSDDDDTLMDEAEEIQDDLESNPTNLLETKTRTKNRVTFEPLVGDESNKEISRNNSKDQKSEFDSTRPSDLIYNIFTKEREEHRRKAVKDGVNKRYDKLDSSENELRERLFEAKMNELEDEIGRMKKNNLDLQQLKRKLQNDRRKLNEDRQSFTSEIEKERRRVDEEKKRLRRDRNLFEKTQQKRNFSRERMLEEEVERLRDANDKLQEEYVLKERKWMTSQQELQSQIRALRADYQQLQDENHKLKLKLVTPKVKFNSNSNPRDVMINSSGASTVAQMRSMDRVENESPDSGIQVKRSSSSNAIETPSMNFSPAESLNSNISLVSGANNINNIESNIGDNKNETDENKTDSSREKIVNVGSSSRVVSERSLTDGSVEVSFSNGNRKVISGDKKSVKVFYYNNDVKESLPNGLVKYYYAKTKTWHLTYPDRREVLRFDNGQEETRYPDGSLLVSFPDGSVKSVSADGCEDLRSPDGSRLQVEVNGDRKLTLPNGHIEWHTASYKRREYPDGTLKTVFNDGRQETRYANGRVRIKDKNGVVTHDSIEGADKTGLKQVATIQS